ncbi:MAG: restriction endonuclease subunit S, partial [Phycisphaerales bacterium]|nr:restriction endonuclease subunit S [Phycisphaerales bacterium]
MTSAQLYNTTRLRFLGHLKGGAGFPHEEQGNTSAAIPFYKVKDLADADHLGFLKKTDNYVDAITAARLGAFVFPRDTIFLAKVGAALLLHRVARASRPSCVDNNMLGIIPDCSLVDPDFLLYAVRTLRFDDVVNPGAVPSIGAEVVSNLPIPTPPLPTQRTIANFLDRKTTAIDALIAKKERLIELLAEKRAALIHQAVTKGLDPSVEMKDSGVEWIGEIPAHWVIKRLKHLISPGSSISYGIVQPGPHIEDGTPFIQTTNISKTPLPTTGLQRTDPKIAAAYPRSKLKAGDLILGIRASIGAVHIVPRVLEGSNLSRGVARIVPSDEVSSRYLRT